MHLLKHALPHYFSKVVHHRDLEPPILYHTSSLDVWPTELVDKSDRFVDRVEVCMAHTTTTGHDGCPPVVDKEHHHMFLRVTVAPSDDHPEETIFVERVLIQQGETPHSVIPVATDVTSPSTDEDEDKGDTLHDHACIILGTIPSSLAHVHHIKADREIHFSDCPDRHLSLFEFATLLRFISAHGLRAVSLGFDTACETYSRWFCRATFAALSAVMRGAFRHWECPKGEAATRIEITTFRSVEAWLRSTFKAYPAQEVADENLVRSFPSFVHACSS